MSELYLREERDPCHPAGRDRGPSRDAERRSKEVREKLRLYTPVVDPGMEPSTPAAWLVLDVDF